MNIRGIKEGRYYHKQYVAIGEECKEIIFVQYVGLNRKLNGWTYRWGFNPKRGEHCWTSIEPAFSFEEDIHFLDDYKLISRRQEKYISPFPSDACNYPSKLDTKRKEL